MTLLLRRILPLPSPAELEHALHPVPSAADGALHPVPSVPKASTKPKPSRPKASTKPTKLRPGAAECSRVQPGAVDVAAVIEEAIGRGFGLPGW